MRQEFTMTQGDFDKIMDACKPVTMIALQCGTPRSPLENANAAWKRLGKQMGFDGMTVQPIPGRSQLAFTAEATQQSTIKPQQEIHP